MERYEELFGFSKFSLVFFFFDKTPPQGVNIGCKGDNMWQYHHPISIVENMKFHDYSNQHGNHPDKA